MSVQMRVCCIQPIRNGLYCLRIENLILLHLTCTSCCPEGIKHEGRLGIVVCRSIIELGNPRRVKIRLENFDVIWAIYLNMEGFTLNWTVLIGAHYADSPAYFLSRVSIYLEEGVGALNSKVIRFRQKYVIFKNLASCDRTP